MARETFDGDSTVREKPAYLKSGAPGALYDDNMPKKAVGRLVSDYIEGENAEAERTHSRARMAELARAKAVRGESDSGAPSEDGETDVNRAEKPFDVAEAIRSVSPEDAVYEADYLEYIHSSADSARRRRDRYLVQPEEIARLTHRHKTVTEEQAREVHRHSEDAAGEVGSRPFRLGANVLIGITSVILLIVLCFFILTIQKLNADIDERNASITTLKRERDAYQSAASRVPVLEGQIESLNAEASALTSENERLLGLLPDANQPGGDGVQPYTPTVAPPTSNPTDPTDPAAAPHASAPTPGYRYILSDDDTLSGISASAYGSVIYYNEIAAANPGVISNPNVVRGGMDIYIPVLE
ncbi:MAG: hypothetical protein LBK41_07665 [Clostridiales bacterium]|jgi:hypothetical protein|nr:hypothetical protein [Clostridiales bacterium]